VEEKEVIDVAKTKAGKKIVPVKGYTKKDGTKVSPHSRSTPD
jgi:hypothetical protein